jgi:uncharacterized membrane-anchored protein
MLNRKGKPMKTYTRTLNTSGMTDDERDAAIKELIEEVENERKRQVIAPSLQRIDEMMKQLDQEKPRKIKVRNQGGQLS